jgi:hypothetical protein
LALQFIQQGDLSVADYISRFAIHAQHTTYDDRSKAGYFYHGLEGTIKNKLVSDEWTTLKQLQNLAMKRDARARERKLEKELEAKSGGHKFNTGTNPPRRNDGTFLSTKPATNPFSAACSPPMVNPFASSTPAPDVSVVDGSTPMELDVQRMVPISAEEKHRCVRESLCFECKFPGHSAKNCRRRIARITRLTKQELLLAENDCAQE